MNMVVVDMSSEMEKLNVEREKLISKEVTIDFGIVVGHAHVNEDGEVVVRFPMGDFESAHDLLRFLQFNKKVP